MEAPAIDKHAASRRNGRSCNQTVWTAASANGSGSKPLDAVGALDVALALDSREVARKLWHMTPGFIILGLPLVRNIYVFEHHLPALIVGFTAVLATLSLVHAKRFSRPGERGWSVSVFAFAATALLPLVAFPGHVEIALTALVILAFGMTELRRWGECLSAARHFPGTKRRRSPERSLLSSGARAPARRLDVPGEFPDSNIPFEIALITGVAAASVAAIAEGIRSSINDNIRVGAAATSMLLLCHWILP